MSAPGPQPSPPFAARELNGATLLEEFQQLREAQIRQNHLVDCALALRKLKTARLSEATADIRQLAAGRFQMQPALASLLVRWAGKMKSEADVPLFVGHLERLALVSALTGAARRGNERLAVRGAAR